MNSESAHRNTFCTEFHSHFAETVRFHKQNFDTVKLGEISVFHAVFAIINSLSIIKSLVHYIYIFFLWIFPNTIISLELLLFLRLV